MFRVDLRLRPDPSSTQIAISTEAALDYYESRGQNWERAALIKARPCAGDLAAGEKFLRDLSPFIWRKYLDYAAVADVHAMKQADSRLSRSRRDCGRGPQYQARPRRHPRDRIFRADPAAHCRRPSRRICAAAAPSPRSTRWPPAAGSTPRGARRADGGLRLSAPRRASPADDGRRADPHAAGRARSARASSHAFSASRTATISPRRCLRHMRTVERHYVRLFEQRAGIAGAAAESVVRDRPRKTRQRSGNRRGRHARSAGANGLSPAARSRRRRAALACGHLSRAARRAGARQSHRARAGHHRSIRARRKIRMRLLPPSTASSPVLRAGGRLLSLLRQNPELIRFVALILGVAPRLADILAQNPHVIDPLIDPSFLRRAAGRKAAGEPMLASALGETRGYEDMLDAIRLFGQEHMFLIGARILSGSVSAEQAGEVFARLADVLIRALCIRASEADFAARSRPHPRRPERDRRARPARRARDDGELRPRPHRDLRFRSRPSEFRRQAPALWRAIFCAFHPAPDQRAHRADQLRRAVSGRHAAAAVGPLRSAGDADRRLRQLSGTRGLDLGAYGADARARRVGTAGFRRAHRGSDPRRALPRARMPTIDRRRRGRRCAARSPRKRAMPTLGISNMPPAGSSISSSSPNICSSCMPRPRRTFSIPRRRGCWKRRRGSACSSRKTPTCCGPRCGCFTT